MFKKYIPFAHALSIYEIDVDFYAGRHPVDHTSDGLTMTLTEGCQPK